MLNCTDPHADPSIFSFGLPDSNEFRAVCRDRGIDTLLRLARAAEYRDDETGAHLHRMSDYAVTIAEAMGQGRRAQWLIKFASPLHDLGKIAIPDAILKKSGPLTEDERAVMRFHPEKGAELLAYSSSPLMQMAHRIALTHHERYDGAGYPAGLAGEEIPLEGRIVAVADVLDALTSRRCYKPAYPMETGLAQVQEASGSHLDPQVVEALMGAQYRIREIQAFHAQSQASKAMKSHGLDALLRCRAPMVI